MRVEPEQLNQLLRPIFSPDEPARAVEEGRVLAKGLAAGPGAATGRVVFNAPDADGVGGARRAGPAGARRHQPRRHPRHGRGPGHPHRARRHDQPRRARRASDGQGLRRGLRGARHRLPARAVRRGRARWSRRATGSASTASPARSSSASSRRVPAEVLQVLLEGTMKPEESQTFQLLREIMEWADASAGCWCAPTPTSPTRRQRHRVRRPGHRPLPHRAHVLRRRAHHCACAR